MKCETCYCCLVCRHWEDKTQCLAITWAVFVALTFVPGFALIFYLALQIQVGT